MGLQSSGALEKVRNYIILKDELLTLPEAGDRSEWEVCDFVLMKCDEVSKCDEVNWCEII